MFAAFIASRFVVVLVLAPTVVEPTILIEELPGKELILPLREGRNEILTAKVTGGEVGAVWLGPDGDTSLRALMTRVGTDTFQINLADDAVVRLVAGEHPARLLRAYAALPGDRIISSIAISVKTGKPHLRLPKDFVEIDAGRYGAPTIDGSDGTLMLDIHEIRRGRAIVSICDLQHNHVLGEKSLRPGVSSTFVVDGATYIIGCRSLEFSLLGHHNRGAFVVCKPDAWKRLRVDIALEQIRKSQDTFLDSEKEITGKEFAKLLNERKMRSSEKPITLDQLISEFAVNSDAGRPFVVRHTDGTSETVPEWLRRQFMTTDEKGHPTSNSSE